MKERAFLLIELIIFLSVFIIIKSIPSNACVEPYSGMEIAEDTEFCPGDWNVSGGVRIVKDNVRLNCKGARLFGEGNVGIYVGNRSGVVVENCGLFGYLTGISSCRLNCFPLSNSKIINNDIRAGTGIVIKTFANSKESKDNVISYNLIKGNPGIEVMHSKGNKITNNLFEGVSLVFSDDNIISNNSGGSISLKFSEKNIVFENRASSISILGRFNLILNNIVTGPFQFNGERGIFVMPNSNFTEISGNTVKGFSYGIYLVNPSNTLIFANNISTVTRANIFIDGTLGENVSTSLNNLLPDFRYHRNYIVNNANTSLNAELNYFGTTNPFLIRYKISGPVKFCPLLDTSYPDGKELSCDEWCKTNICPKA